MRTWTKIEPQDIQTGHLIQIVGTGLEGVCVTVTQSHVTIFTSQGHERRRKDSYSFNKAPGTYRKIQDFSHLRRDDEILAYSALGSAFQEGKITDLGSTRSGGDPDRIRLAGGQTVLFSMREVYRLTPDSTPASVFKAPEVGDRFNRTWDNGERTRDCTVQEVQEHSSLSLGTYWLIRYSWAGSSNSQCRVFPDGTIRGGFAGTTNTGRYVPAVIPMAAWEQALIPPTPEPVRLYPTVHHLRAAVYEHLLEQVTKGVWCEEGVKAFMRKEGISYGSERDKEHVDNLITMFQDVNPYALNIEKGELDKALNDLGIARPRTKELTVTVQVPVDTDPETVRGLLQAGNTQYEVKEIKS